MKKFFLICFVIFCAANNGCGAKEESSNTGNFGPYPRDSIYSAKAKTDDTELSIEKYLLELLNSNPDRFQEIAAATSGIVKLQLTNGIVCSGWMITSRHMITNQHCVKDDFAEVPSNYNKVDDFDRTTCPSMRVLTGYQEANGSLRQSSDYTPPAPTTIACKQILVANQSRDVALVELRSDVPETVKPLKPFSNYMPNGQESILVGHPGGRQKKIYYYTKSSGRIENCIATAMSYPPGKVATDDLHPWHDVKNPNSFVHSCAGPGGTSGSPVFDSSSLKVIGLHWNDSNDCTWGHYRSREEGGIWDSKERQYYWPGSRAVSIEAIRTFFAILPEGDSLGKVPGIVREAFGI